MSNQNEKTKGYGEYLYSSFGSNASESSGRLVDEPESPTRTAFQRDRDRIVHSGAFRRLKHKTQVFVYHEGDYYRTRLTHSLEVAQIGRSISRALGLDEDLCEALALAHDLGHTPFGHAGEGVVDQCMKEMGEEGFDHNVQSLRVVTQLEHRYAEFDGLNLTWETLEGLVKHNGPIETSSNDRDVPKAFLSYSARHDLRLATYASAEAQVAALSDDIAYNNHDLDDGLRAGLFDIEDLKSLPLVGDLFREVERMYPNIEKSRWVHEAIRRLISHMVTDALNETRQRIEDGKIGSAEDVRLLGRPTVAFSPEMGKADKALKSFLFNNMYRHDQVLSATNRAKEIVKELFEHYVKDPKRLPEEWRNQMARQAEAKTPRIICDYIAGMTDRFAMAEHSRSFSQAAGDSLRAGDFL